MPESYRWTVCHLMVFSAKVEAKHTTDTYFCTGCCTRMHAQAEAQLVLLIKRFFFGAWRNKGEVMRVQKSTVRRRGDKVEGNQESRQSRGNESNRYALKYMISATRPE